MDTLLSVGLISSFMALLIAWHRHWAARPFQAVLILSADDVDAEFFRIVDREALRGVWPTS